MIPARPARALLGLVAGALLLGGCRSRESRQEAAAAPVAARPTEAPTSELQKLVGRWLRSDSDYTIEIRGVAPDGTADATYENPNPIHVARALARSQGGNTLFFLELQDRGYPGSFYALAYDPGSDSLSGEYHHLGVNQVFQVAFSRLDGKAPGDAGGPR